MFIIPLGIDCGTASYLKEKNMNILMITY